MTSRGVAPGRPADRDPRLVMNMEAKALLATSPASQDELADRIARIACREVADFCAIAVLSEDGHALHPLGLFHRREEVMAELEAQAELAWGPTGGLSQRALDTGQPVLVKDGEADPDQIARGRPLARVLLPRLAMASAIVAPLRSAGTNLGILSVGRTGARRPFVEGDLPLIQALADTVALGLDNARLRERLDGLTASALPPATEDVLQRLTGREREILRLIGEGLTNREIGEQLYLSVRTIEWHRSNLSTKLGLTQRSQLIAAGRRVAR